MQLLIAIELALMLVLAPVLALKVSFGNIERDLKRKPLRYEEGD